MTSPRSPGSALASGSMAMGMGTSPSVSPSALFNSSSRLHGGGGSNSYSNLSSLLPAESKGARVVLPTFPIEVQKRILHFALALPPLYASPAGISRSKSSRTLDEHFGHLSLSSHGGAGRQGVQSQEDGDDDEFCCEDFGGRAGRMQAIRRICERGGVSRQVLTLMRVCKLWKKEALAYLYAEPRLMASNLIDFADRLIRGDKTWSDINLHPISIPSRYVITLDLSGVSRSKWMFGDSHSTILSEAILRIIPLVPNLKHLVMPDGSESLGLSTDKLKSMMGASVKGLKSLDGLQVTYTIDHLFNEAGSARNGTREDSVVRLLRGMRSLELLSVEGPGDCDCPSLDQLVTVAQTPLDLPNLHTVFLAGVKSGILLHTLINSELPSLRRVMITPYDGCLDDLTSQFLQVHGDKLLSLTYPSSRDWPSYDRPRPLPPLETLEWCGKLKHLSYLRLKDLDRLRQILEYTPDAGLRVASSHPLRSITVPKWTRDMTDQSTSLGESLKALMDSLAQNPPSNLSWVKVDQFRWVRQDLGVRALQTGDSREMRRWADKLKLGNIGLRDVEGNSQPSLDQTGGYGVQEGLTGRRRSSVKVIRGFTDRLDEDGG